MLKFIFVKLKKFINKYIIIYFIKSIILLKYLLFFSCKKLFYFIIEKFLMIFLNLTTRDIFFIKNYIL